ncbi:MAG: adenylate/guanylate cyclase domain-containing protein, partial [Gammaproteobacteria bacterium]
MERRLAAILTADAVGYTQMMARDEVATLETLDAYRSIMGGLIKQHGGRVVDAVGDNLLAEFPSAVDAVQCAIEIQRQLAENNAERPEDKQMRFRIGINVGDLIVIGDRIVGDGVNVAARIEAEATP